MAADFEARGQAAAILRKSNKVKEEKLEESVSTKINKIISA
jgi:hypothetical protein